MYTILFGTFFDAVALSNVTYSVSNRSVPAAYEHRSRELYSTGVHLYTVCNATHLHTSLHTCCSELIS